jgi:BirA family biotin operon repressor/biotin-[acetyl-CoA-carboxylase] ligase
MRWPNDVLVKNAKLAGILIDQFVPGRCVLGIGINVNNHPDQHDRSLGGQVARLADLVNPVPLLTEVLDGILAKIEALCSELATFGPVGLLPEINALWPEPVGVELDLEGEVIRGAFQGVDTAGRLRLQADGGEMRFYEPHQVRLFRETIHP